MLKHWDSHAEYQQFISETVSHLNESQFKKLSSYKDSLDKLTSLNLDPVGDFLQPFYSNTGRPALHQAQILRSFVLMMDQKVLSLTNWVETLSQDVLLAMMIGCSLDSLPPLGSYYDFINRLWQQHPDTERFGRKILFPVGKNQKPKLKLQKGKKLPNRHNGITNTIADFVRTGKDVPFHYEIVLQKLFSIAAIVPSMELGLISSDGITISGDGTCVHTHANPHGKRVCKCAENGMDSCTCNRHYSDPDAAWGWDSDLNTYFFGHTLYMLSCHNEKLKIDLPLYIRFFDAKRHDSVSGILSLADFLKVTPEVKIDNVCLDSAHDNYPTYQLCKEWNITPFIDLNTNRGKPKTIPDEIEIDTDGTPKCQAGHRMVYNGYCSGRSRIKWRCPFACGKVDDCACKSNCSPSPYGRCIYTKPDWDIRLYTPVPRGTDAYKKIYNNRTGSERVNNRILNHYHLHDMRIHGKKRYSFFTMIAGINIHLDARIKVKNSKVV